MRICLKARILPTFGRMPLDRIGHKDVAAWFDAACKDRPGAANRALEILRAMMFRAEEWGLREPDAYLFPLQAEGRGTYSLTTCWRTVCANAGLGRLRPLGGRPLGRGGGKGRHDDRESDGDTDPRHRRR